MIEAYIASQTKPSFVAVAKALKLEQSFLDENNLNLIEKFLVSSQLLSKLSLSTHLDVVENIAKNSKLLPNDIQFKGFLTLGSLVYLSSFNSKLTSKAEQSLDLILNQTKQTVIKDTNTKLAFLESLKNTRHPTCFEEITKFNDFKSAKLQLSALKYFINSLNESFFDKELLNNLLSIVYDKNMRDELRIEALNIILDKYSDLLVANDSPLLENIFRKIFKEKEKKTSKEFVFFCQQLVWSKIKSNKQFRLNFHLILKYFKHAF